MAKMITVSDLDGFLISIDLDEVEVMSQSPDSDPEVKDQKGILLLCKSGTEYQFPVANFSMVTLYTLASHVLGSADDVACWITKGAEAEIAGKK